MIRTLIVAVVLFLASFTRPALAQNPVQWSGSVAQSVARAREQALPLLFWVSEGVDRGDDDDLRDAQMESFRDRTVVAIIHKRYVPVRVSRNSRVLEEAQKLGLPTTFGLFAAVITPEGKVLGEIGPGEIADPMVFAGRLTAIFAKYRDELYQTELKPRIEGEAVNKAQARLAAQTVWRLGILSADKGMIALAERPDLNQTERSRLYALLGSLATKPCIDFLLGRAEGGEKDAAQALLRAEPGALEWLVPEMPGPAGDVTPRQMAAYRAVTRLCRFPTVRDEAWWNKATPEERAKELERVTVKAGTVLEFWIETEGRWR